MSSIDKAKLKLDLPPHCQVKKRPGGYYDVYFMPHPKDRPAEWPATLHLGRSDSKSAIEIKKIADSTYSDYLDFRATIAIGQKPARDEGTLPDVIRKYRASGFWEDISKRTRRDYELYLREIEIWSEKSGHPHIKHMTPKAIVKWLKRYEDTPVAQRRAKTVLSILYKIAILEGYVDRNIIPDITLRKRRTEKRKLVVWEDSHVQAFVSCADQMGHPSVGRALIMALETAQRRGDILRMQKPRDYDPQTGRLKFEQSKTGKLVNIKATSLLRKALEDIPAEQLPLFVNEKTGRPWHPDVFTHTFREIADKAGLKYHIFAHTRHSSILYLHRAGVETKGIASITGHSLKTVDAMLENHYLETRDQEVADQAIEQLEKYRVRQRHVRQRSDK